MNTAVMKSKITDVSPRFKARTAGFFWLMTIVTGTVAMVVRGRLGAVANVIAGVCYLAATVLVYDLLRPVSKSLSLLAAVFSLVGCAVGFLLREQAGMSFVFFGLHCLLIGTLILRSIFLPRFVGVLMALGGLGWLTLGLASLLSPPFSRSVFPYIAAPGILGEASLTLWLLAVGVNVQRWKEQARAAPGAAIAAAA